MKCEWGNDDNDVSFVFVTNGFCGHDSFSACAQCASDMIGNANVGKWTHWESILFVNPDGPDFFFTKQGRIESPNKYDIELYDRVVEAGIDYSDAQSLVKQLNGV